MKTIVYIDGDQGTTGLQIVSRLEGREDIALRTLPAALRKDPAARAEALDGCDVAILCLPDATAREAVGMVRNRRVRIIDASSAHRIDPGWTYGFAEMAAGQDERIRTSRRVSNPGCYPTGAVALLRPLIAAGLLPADHPVAIHAVSGYSGKGRAGVDAYEGPDRGAAPAFQVYGLDLDHKHVPEIRAHAGLTEAPIFVPAYGAFRQGIVLTIPLHLRLLPDGSDARRLRDCLADHYAGRRRVSVAGGDDTPTPAHLDPCALVGSDDLSLAVHGDAGRSRVLLSAVFDNLGKGAAGAALQNLDLMLGR